MKLKLKIIFLFTALIFYSFTIADASRLSNYHQLNIDPFSKDKVGDNLLKEIKQFFQEAKTAIETKNINSLMDLYSANYQNGIHNKSMVKEIWKRLFSDFDTLTTTHNLAFTNTDSTNSVVILRCAGLLMGKPKQDKEMISLDTWTNNTHVLAKENGKWRIMGNTGKERKRFWFSKPLHPLF